MESERAARSAGPKLIQAAVNFDELFREIYGFEGGLVEACESHMKELDKRDQSTRFGDLLDTFEKSHDRNWGKSYRTHWNTLRKILFELEGRSVILLDVKFWSEWLETISKEKNWSDRTYNDYTSMLSSVWKFGVKHELTEKNPIDGIIRRKLRKKTIAVYSVNQVKTVLSCAWNHDRDLVPFFAIAIFAGVRPDVTGELGRLEWEDINFEEKWIRVAAKFDNKTETKRFVPIEPNLLTWLNNWKGEKGLILPKNFVKRRRYVTRGKYQSPPRTPSSKWKELVPYGSKVRDITRHTYGSYLEAKYRDRNIVKENMGHSDFDTFEQHYRNARTPKQAEQFWAISAPRT